MKTQLSMAMLLVISLLFFAAPFKASAQERELQLDINYAIGIPGSSFKSDAVDKASFRGWTANLMYNITDKISIGVGTGFQDFYQKYSHAQLRFHILIF